MREPQALVTGAAGFIGSHLVERLLADGVAVTGVDCFTETYDAALKRQNLERALAHPSFRLLELDLVRDDLGQLPAASVVFHLAAQPGVRSSWGEDFAVYLERNVLATQRLLERYAQEPPGRFVYSSSSSVYGDAEHYPTAETVLPRPFSPYGMTKLAGEHLVLLYGRNFGLPVVALRYFTVYGPRQRPDMAFHRFCRSLLRGEPLTVYGDGSQSRDFTFVSDAVEANVRAWREPRAGGVYNVGGGSQVELRQAIAILGLALGVKPDLRLEPRPPGDPMRTCADTARLEADLGFRPAVGIEHGLAAQATWARDLYARERP
jgi:UDP-glucose 4-epimerase